MPEPRRVTQDTLTGSHSSPVRPATGTVATRAVEDEDADGGGHARCVGLPPQDQHPEQQPDGHGDDLAGTGSGQRAAPLARPEPVARTAAAHPPSPPCPGGQAGGSHLITGPWPSSPM